jgi:hypothetical protein
MLGFPSAQPSPLRCIADTPAVRLAQSLIVAVAVQPEFAIVFRFGVN